MSSCIPGNMYKGKPNSVPGIKLLVGLNEF